MDARVAETCKLADTVDAKTTKGKHGGARANSGGKREGSGRKKGVPNKVTADLKKAILGALHAKGGQEYLEKVAQEDPRTFCTLLGKVLPMTVAGDPDNPLETISSIKISIVDANG